MSLASQTYARRMPCAIEVLGREFQSTENRRPFYRDTPLAELIDIVYAQVDVMLGHLTGDHARAKRGVQLAVECKGLAVAKRREWLSVEIGGAWNLVEIVTAMEQGAESA